MFCVSVRLWRFSLKQASNSHSASCAKSFHPCATQPEHHSVLGPRRPSSGIARPAWSRDAGGTNSRPNPRLDTPFRGALFLLFFCVLLLLLLNLRYCSSPPSFTPKHTCCLFVPEFVAATRKHELVGPQLICRPCARAPLTGFLMDMRLVDTHEGNLRIVAVAHEMNDHLFQILTGIAQVRSAFSPIIAQNSADRICRQDVRIWAHRAFLTPKIAWPLRPPPSVHDI